MVASDGSVSRIQLWPAKPARALAIGTANRSFSWRKRRKSRGESLNRRGSFDHGTAHLRALLAGAASLVPSPALTDQAPRPPGDTPRQGRPKVQTPVGQTQLAQRRSGRPNVVTERQELHLSIDRVIDRTSDPGPDLTLSRLSDTSRIDQAGRGRQGDRALGRDHALCRHDAPLSVRMSQDQRVSSWRMVFQATKKLLRSPTLSDVLLGVFEGPVCHEDRSGTTCLWQPAKKRSRVGTQDALGHLRTPQRHRREAGWRQPS